MIALIMLSSCHVGCGVASTTTDAVTPTATDYTSSTMPDDFYIIYESSWGNENINVILLDTQNNTIGAPAAFPDFCISTDFHIPHEALQTIHDAIVEYDIKSLGGLNMSQPPHLATTPRIFYKITFCMDGVIYSVVYDNGSVRLDSKTYPGLVKFHHLLNGYYQSTDEYKSFPRPPILT